MNPEKPKMKPWPQVIEECNADLLLLEQQMIICRAVLTEAKSYVKK